MAKSFRKSPQPLRYAQQPDESFLNLEDTLVEETWERTAYAIVEELRTVCRSRNLSGRDQITAALTDLLSPWAQEYHFESRRESSSLWYSG